MFYSFMLIIVKMSSIASTFTILFCVMFSSVTSIFFSAGLQDDCRQLGKKQVAIFVLGDSVYDPGNNDFLNISIDRKANYPPYGETFFKFPTGRFCDGRQISDFAAMYANLPVWEPYLQPGRHNFANGASFASAGACVLVETSKETLNLRIQLGYLKEVANLLKVELGDTEAKKILKNAIYLSSFGGVDYFAFSNTYTNDTESQMQEYVNMVIGNFTEVTKEIYDMGGRKFAFQNVGPLGCLPMAKQLYNLSGEACVAELQTLASLHNNALSIVAKELETQLSGFKYLIFDFFNKLNDMINHHEKYGFKVSDIACCGTGSRRGTGCGKFSADYELCTDPYEYLFFDGSHATEHGNSVLAAMLWYGVSNATWPLNMKQLYELEILSADEDVSDDGGLFNDE